MCDKIMRSNLYIFCATRFGRALFAAFFERIARARALLTTLVNRGGQRPVDDAARRARNPPNIRERLIEGH